MSSEPDQYWYCHIWTIVVKDYIKNYWTLLKTLPVSSLERSKKQYAIIYTWRMLEGQVPNIGTQE